MTPHEHPEPIIFLCDRERFQTEIIGGSHQCPILVDFWADWCTPCHTLAPQLERVVAGLDGALRLAKIEVDAGENMKLAGHYRLRGFPTVMLFHEGKELGRFSGSRTSHQIRDWLHEHLGDRA